MGTSGWMYDWNKGGDLRWYAIHSGLNAVELNASFYRFPFPSQIMSWTKVGSGLRWSVKVHRSVSHVHRLNEASLKPFRRFLELMMPLDPLVDFYLVQLPPSFSMNNNNVGRLESFVSMAKLGHRLAVEFRHTSWFNDEALRLAERLGFTLVSVDSPEATFIRASNGILYLRLHGRSAWYAHEYTEDELRGLAGEVRRQSPEAVYVFFNNDHWMLENARLMLRLLAT